MEKKSESFSESNFHNCWWWTMNERNSKHWDMFSLPLVDGTLLNIELYSCNAFLSINSTLNVGLSIWWIAKAHNKMHFIMYMWQPHLLLKYLPNTTMLLKSSKINIKPQPQVRISFLLNNRVLPQIYPNLKVQVFSSESRVCRELSHKLSASGASSFYLWGTTGHLSFLLLRQKSFHAINPQSWQYYGKRKETKKPHNQLAIDSGFHIKFYFCLHS